MTEEATIKKVLLQYDIGKLKQYELLGGGFVNENYMIITSKGIYFFREYKHNFKVAEIRRVNRLLIELKDKNFTVARPILTKEGDTVVEFDGQAFSISEYIKGEKYDFSEKQFMSAAKTLAQFHKEVQGVESESKFIRNCKQIGHIAKLWKGKDSILKQLKSKKPLSEVDFVILEAIPRMKHHLELLIGDFPYLRERTNASVMHGDFWHGQLIFHENEVAALIDFDKIILGSTEYDLVKGARSFAKAYRRPGYNLTKLKKFVKAYKQVFGKVDLEPREVLAFLRHALLEITGYFIEVPGFQQQKEEVIVSITYHLEELDWIELHEDEIIKSFLVK